MQDDQAPSRREGSGGGASADAIEELLATAATQAGDYLQRRADR